MKVLRTTLSWVVWNSAQRMFNAECRIPRPTWRELYEREVGDA